VFFRVYSGHLKKGDTIYNPRTRKRERVSRLMVIQGSERKDIDPCMRATSRRLSVCATSPPVTRCAMRL
jgi:translation elongation factor EF-G